MNINVRSVRDLGISKNANKTYMNDVKSEFNISKKMKTCLYSITVSI